MNAADLVLVTCDYKVMALRKADGAQVWETVLVSKFFKPSMPFVTLVMDEAGVYAHTCNQLFRLDLETGRILWQQELASGRWLGAPSIASIAVLGAGASAAQVAQTISARKSRDSDAGAI